MGTIPPRVASRFWSKVDRKSPSECWIWKAAVSRNGYGVFAISGSLRTTAHRFAWLLRRGDIPEGMTIVHTCESKLCANPKHLRIQKGSGLPQNRRIARFWDQTRKLRGHRIWQGAIGTPGYGITNLFGRQDYAHRVAWMLAFGPIPKGKIIRHGPGCPRSCVEPAHLSVGTPTDNAADRVRDEAMPRGVRHPGAKLTPSKVRAIRRLYAGGEVTWTALAKRFGVGVGAIQCIIERRNWAWLK